MLVGFHGNSVTDPDALSNCINAGLRKAGIDAGGPPAGCVRSGQPNREPCAVGRRKVFTLVWRSLPTLCSLKPSRFE